MIMNSQVLAQIGFYPGKESMSFGWRADWAREVTFIVISVICVILVSCVFCEIKGKTIVHWAFKP
jgi:hypothetical protein